MRLDVPFARALAARDGMEFWCYAQPASRTADRRFVSWLRLDMSSDIAWRFGRRLAARMVKQANETTRKCRDTLFVHMRPEHFLAME